MYAADRVDNLSVDRRIFKSPENKLSNKVYRMMESYEEDFPEALVKLRHDEEDYSQQGDRRGTSRGDAP